MAALTPEDRAQLSARGLTPEALDAQVAQLRAPAPLVLERPCTVGDGIVRLSTAEQARLADLGEEAAAAGRVMKFVPASGAATRMFKDLVTALAAEGPPSASPGGGEFFQRFDDFPFAPEVRRLTGIAGPPADPEDERRIIRAILEELQLGDLPKALIPFHRVAGGVRTAFEEHLLESTRYTRALDGTCRVHFTVSPDVRDRFEALLARLAPGIEAQCREVRLDVSFSEQHPATDTVALDARGELFRDADGRLVFRPSGHGALLRNLQDTHGDIVVIKNIDNVVPDETGAEAFGWKRLLIGCLVEMQATAFRHLEACRHVNVDDSAIDEALAFAARHFARVPLDARTDRESRRAFALDALDRPIRVCGVVRNEGEPGGAPFWVRDDQGRLSIQVVEAAQVQVGNQEQARIFGSATHFNPVDLVCGLRSSSGAPFDLGAFVDERAAFVATKSHEGRELTALERPGLWNGAMAGWNTLCVEVPATTFAPVKTVFDLIRPQHQHRGSPADVAVTRGAVTG